MKLIGTCFFLLSSFPLFGIVAGDQIGHYRVTHPYYGQTGTVTNVGDGGLSLDHDGDGERDIGGGVSFYNNDGVPHEGWKWDLIQNFDPPGGDGSGGGTEIIIDDQGTTINVQVNTEAPDLESIMSSLQAIEEGIENNLPNDYSSQLDDIINELLELDRSDDSEELLFIATHLENLVMQDIGLTNQAILDVLEGNLTRILEEIRDGAGDNNTSDILELFRQEQETSMHLLASHILGVMEAVQANDLNRTNELIESYNIEVNGSLALQNEWLQLIYEKNQTSDVNQSLLLNPPSLELTDVDFEPFVPEQLENEIFPLFNGKLNEFKSSFMEVTRYDEIENLANSLPDAPDEEPKWTILTMGDYTFEIDLTGDEVETYVAIGRVGFTLVIVWGLLWGFWRLNAVLLAT
jgi:hypothetical protein